MKESARSRRVGDQIQKELATLVQVLSRDENLGLVTLSAIHLSTDFLHAKVLFTYLNNDTDEGGKIEFLLNVLNDHSPKFRHHLSQNLHIRVVPRLEFIYDYHLEKANKLSHLIDSLHTNS